MSNISFRAELDNRIKKDGTSNIQIRVTQNRRLIRITIGVSVPPEHWNPEKSEVRKINPQYRQINALLRSKMLELEKNYLQESVMNKVSSAENLVRKLKKEIVGESFLDYADARILKMPSGNTRKSQTSIIKKLRDYVGTKGLYFMEINYEFIMNYERYLKKIGNNKNTIRSNMKTIQGIYNEAFNSHYFVPEHGSPWNVYKHKKEKSKRTRLSEVQVAALEKLDIRPGINEWHSRNIFLMSFYLQGMRAADVLQLKWGQVKGDRLEYQAGKTEKFRSKKLIDRALAILSLYRYNGQRPSDYIFPFLKSKNRKQFTDDQWVNVIDSANTLIRGHLMELAPRIGAKKLSLGVARHTYADIANQKTGDIRAVSNSMDHSSVSITEGYFNDVTLNENDELVDIVYGS